MRTLVDLPEADIKALDDCRRRRSASRAAVIREAVREYLHRQRQADPAAAFGLWRRDGAETVDGVAYQRRLREEW